MSNKTIYLLIGQKGSGKSFIGTIFENEFGIQFIRVEDWAKKVKKDRDIDNEIYLKQVFEVIENGIREHLHKTDQIVFESTGLSDYFDQMLQRLKKDYCVITIGIYADGQICLDRVRTRDQSIHIDVSDNQVEMINRKVRERNYNTDFKIVNRSKTREELSEELAKIIDVAQRK